MERIYISGKITGLDLKIAKNMFKKAYEKLSYKYDEVVNPMEEVVFNPSWTWEMYMIEDIKLLFSCNHIYMLKNWKESRGARIEHSIAIEIGIKIIYQ